MPAVRLLLLTVVGLASGQLAKLSVDPATGKFTDGTGRIITLRGINSVIKGHPWYDPIMLDPTRLDQLQEMGFNVVRLGAMWTGVEPEQGERNMTYVNVLKDIVTALEERGIYTLLDLHQDVLWEAVDYDDNNDGYWGVPPYVKDKLPQTDPAYPWPLSSDLNAWACGYFTKEIAEGFQMIYNNTASTGDDLAAHWKFIAEQFGGYNGVVGYELINEPFAGDVYSDAGYLLPGVVGYENLEPLYNKIHNAVREADDTTIIFWEPITWAFLAPFNPGPAFDAAIREICSHYTVMDMLDLLEEVCGELQLEPPVARKRPGLTDIMKALENKDFIKLSTIAKEYFPELARLPEYLLDDSKGDKAYEGPSVFGPGLTQVPGGEEYLNRTVMAWHYYCEAASYVYGEVDADPQIVQLCDEVLGPNTFDNVAARASNLGGSATMLTEFGICFPNVTNPGSEGSVECEFVIGEMEARFESWTYWDTASGGALWVDGEIDMLRAPYFSRPFPWALAGTPVSLKFDVVTREFELVYRPDASSASSTEILVPDLQYPEGSYVVEASAGLRVEVREQEGSQNTILAVTPAEDGSDEESSYIRLSPSREEDTTEATGGTGSGTNGSPHSPTALLLGLTPLIVSLSFYLLFAQCLY